MGDLRMKVNTDEPLEGARDVSGDVSGCFRGCELHGH